MRRTMVKMAALLALGLGVGPVLVGGPPPGPPPTPPPEPPPPPTYPCAFSPLPADLAAQLRETIPLEPDLREAARALDRGGWPLAYTDQDLQIHINPERTGLPALVHFPQLQRGAFIGGLRSHVRFHILDRGQCFLAQAPAPAHDEGLYLLWMAHLPTLGIPLPPELAGKFTWFLVWIKVADPPEPVALTFYPDSLYHSPEEMLKAARSLADGGLLAPKPSGSAQD